MKKLLILIMCMMLCMSSALAAPIITAEGYTAYLGSSDYLYLKDAAGVTKVLQSPIADLVSMNATELYCLTQDGRLFRVKLDGSATEIVSAAPTEADFAAVATPPVYTLENGVLSVPDATGASQILSGSALMASAAGTDVYYVEAVDTAAAGFVLKHGKTQPAPQSAVLRASVSEPVSMIATPEAVVMITKARTLEIIDTATGGLQVLPVQSDKTDAAFCFDGKLVQLATGDDGVRRVESVTEHVLNDVTGAVPVAQKLTATATPTITATPRPTVLPTATPKPSGSTSADDDEYESIHYGDRGSAVRSMQKRLNALGYPVGKVDGAFGDNTLLAVNLFQCAIGYRERDYATSAMLERLYSKKAPKYDPFAELKEGDQGADVRLMQTALFDLGYDLGEKGVDGKFGKDTKAAVEQFQLNAELEVTGVATPETLKLLFDKENPIPNVTPTPPADDPTEPPADDPTEPPADDPTEPPADDPTEPPADDPTEPPADDPTEPPADDPTEPPADDPTEPPADDPTEPPADDPTEPPADDPVIGTPTDLIP